MRLPVDARCRFAVLGLSVALAGCGLVGGGDRPESLAAAPAQSSAVARNGPAADYPIVVGEPFSVQGELYTPADTLNYDEVGYAALDPQTGAGVTVAHKTLPLPSYVEVTALDSGKTILARVERRGPMTAARLVALSGGAQAQLGVGEGTPVRVRRVNPPEADRAELRAGRAAPERMETPKSLADVLRRKLPAEGVASLRSAASAPVPALQPVRTAQQVSPPPPSSRNSAPTVPPRAATAYPLPPLAGTPRAASPTVVRIPRPAPPRAPSPRVDAVGEFVVQVAAFASKANADRAAARLGGFVTPAGNYFRVRTGPYGTRGQAEAALAKVRAAGYSDARVFTAS